MTIKNKNDISTTSGRSTLAQVSKEMGRPRLSTSVRDFNRTQRELNKVAPTALPVTGHARVSVPVNPGNQGLVLHNKLLQEVQRLKRLSGRLDLLAGGDSSLAEALIPISAGILRFATVLKVLVISKSGVPSVQNRATVSRKG